MSRARAALRRERAEARRSWLKLTKTPIRIGEWLVRETEQRRVLNLVCSGRRREAAEAIESASGCPQAVARAAVKRVMDRARADGIAVCKGKRWYLIGKHQED